MQKIEVGKTYVFTKSGNKVRALEQTGKNRIATFWLVERLDGESKGKQMIVTADALATENH